MAESGLAAGRTSLTGCGLTPEALSARAGPHDGTAPAAIRQPAPNSNAAIARKDRPQFVVVDGGPDSTVPFFGSR